MSGNYDGAREVMGELWIGVGEQPQLSGLARSISAEVLLRAGSLTGHLGSIKQFEGAQELAKNLISKSIAIFAELNDSKKVAEARADLAVCYWREGAYDEARIILKEALISLTKEDTEIKAIALYRSAFVEKLLTHYNDALQLYMEAAPFFERINNDSFKGRFYNGFANLLVLLAQNENRYDYRDRAFIEFAAASYHFEQAGNGRLQACVENNLGFLFCTIGKFAEAHEHLDRAQALFTSLKDNVHLAQVDETRGRVFLREGRTADAERFARAAVQVLERGGEQSLLAEALTTHGVTLARLG
ncbi:MAG: tetratricopeptide repeat protein, partial [Acidobacteriota bacterium]|nr:tetratricopeptide repeat protein [Acidobacteriota bacterium]